MHRQYFKLLWQCHFLVITKGGMFHITKRKMKEEITSAHLSRETGMGGFLHLISHKNPENNSNCRIRSSFWNTRLDTILLFTLLQLFLVAPASAFQIGDKIQATTFLNVRDCYFLICNKQGTVSSGSTGTILNGSYTGDGYTWWYIGWNNGLQGYSVEDWLGSVALPTPTISSISPSTITQGTSYQNVTVYGSNFTSSSYHQYSVSGGSSWAWATSPPTINGSTSMTIGVNNTAVQTDYFRVCASLGSTACSVKVPVTIQAASSAASPNTGVCQVNGPTSALLFGTVNPNGTSTTAWFQWGISTAYGNVTATKNVGNGTSVVQVTPQISGLLPNTTYNFRIVGQNSAGTKYGINLTCTTLPPAVIPPKASTGSATYVASSSAILNGTINSNGAPTKGWFEWGPSTAYGNSTSPLLSGSSGTNPVPISVSISGLIQKTTYYFRAVGQNSAGSSYGNVYSFTTAAVPNNTPPPTCNSHITRTVPNSRYKGNGNGTITDLKTGLMWKVCSEGQGWSAGGCSGTAGTYTWQGALQIPQALNVAGGFAGYTDWRLSNIKELASIVELACTGPAINVAVFPSTPSFYYWSASPRANHSYDAWGVGFGYGDDGYANRGYAGRVRLVRGGQ